MNQYLDQSPAMPGLIANRRIDQRELPAEPVADKFHHVNVHS
jgi:hypothetical protein